jgi:hypothetical protein
VGIGLFAVVAEGFVVLVGNFQHAEEIADLRFEIVDLEPEPLRF